MFKWGALNGLAVGICKVRDYGLQTYQTNPMLWRATTFEFTAVSPIFHMHSCRLAFLLAHNLYFVLHLLLFAIHPS